MVVCDGKVDGNDGKVDLCVGGEVFFKEGGVEGDGEGWD